MWKASEHPDCDNERWVLLRSIEWIHWPLWFSQVIVPVLLFFCDWQWVVLSSFGIAFFWRLFIARNFVSVWLADFGAFSMYLKFAVCPVMAFLIWRSGDDIGAWIALLWPAAVLVLMGISNLLFFIGLRRELEMVRDLFAKRILANRLTRNEKLQVVFFCVLGFIWTTSWTLVYLNFIPE
jgi:hypothetical protein